ncbi:MAG TPA: FHA domain-containing protein, partial [Anaerolineaceae bacterium]
GFALAFLVLWVGSIAAVAAHARRRELPGAGRWLWIGLAVLLPIAGFFLYWIVFLIGHFMSSGRAEVEPARRRVTQPLHVAPSPGIHTTIPAADLIESTIAYQESPSASLPAAPLPPASTQPGCLLAATDGPHQGDRFSLNHLPALIGRSAEAAVLLSRDLQVSRKHAEVYENQGTLRIRDLGSLYGTRVNGNPVRDAALIPGDSVRVGGSTLRVESQGR